MLATRQLVTSSKPQCRPLLSRAPVAPSKRAGALIVRAEQNGNGNDKPNGNQEKVDKVLEELKKTGMTTAKAKEVLKAWSKVGVEDPEQLRKLLIKRSLQPLPVLGVQTLLDAVAAFGGFFTASIISSSGEFPGKILLEIFGNFVGCYYTVQVLLELTVVSAILYTTYKYGTNSKELLTAVQTLAGPPSGVGVVDKAQKVVNTVKVIQEQYGNAEAKENDSLKNLSAYLTLSRAKEKYGFNPEELGISEKQAGNIAYAFSIYDLNDNGQLEKSELGNLCSTLGKQLDADELQDALDRIDLNQNGVIEFTEFVSWWIGKTKTADKPAPAAMRK